MRGEPNVSYICSRYYRAPELIFGATDYTSQIGKARLGSEGPQFFSFFSRIIIQANLCMWYKIRGCSMAQIYRCLKKSYRKASRAIHWYNEKKKRSETLRKKDALRTSAEATHNSGSRISHKQFKHNGEQCLFFSSDVFGINSRREGM